MLKRILFTLVLCSAAFAQTKIVLTAQTQGTLSQSQGGTGSTVLGANGQVLICDGVGHCSPGDPIVSFNFVNLLTTKPATSQQISAPNRISIFSVTGTLYISFAGITGSPSVCTAQLVNYDSLGNSVLNGSPIALTVANGTATANVASVAPFLTAAQLGVTYACSVYPTAGTVSLDFVPLLSSTSSGGGGGGNVNVTQFGTSNVVTGTGVSGAGIPRVTVSSDSFPATQAVSGTVTTTPPANATTNVTQFGGTNLSTGTGTGGAGIPRITVSSDSFPATQTVAGTVTTTPPSNATTNVTQFGGTNVSTGTGVSGAGIPRVTVSSDSFPATQAVSGTVTTTPPANASTNLTQVGGTNVSTGTGAGGVGIPRVTISNDSSLAANQSVNVNQIGGSSVTLGSKTSANSIPVVVASDQGALSVNNTQQGTAAQNITQFGGSNLLTGTGLSGNGIPRVTVSSDSFPATQAISAASLPLPTGAATSANQTNGSQVVQITQTAANQVPINVAIANQPQIQKVQNVNTPLNPAVTTLVGAPTISQGSPGVTTAGWPMTNGLSAPVQAKWDSTTLSGSTLNLSTNGYATVELSVNTGNTTAGTVQFEVQDANSGQWFVTTGVQRANAFGQTTIGTTSTSVTLGSFVNQSWEFNVAGYSAFRARINSVVTGTGIATLTAQASAASIGFAPETMAQANGPQTAMPNSMVIVGYKNANSQPVPLSGDGSGDINVNVAPGVSSQTINTSNYTTFTSATAVNSVAQIVGTTPNASGANSLSYSISVPSNVTGGCIVFESSTGDGIWYPAAAVNYATGAQVGTLCFQPSANTLVIVTNPGAFAQRLRLTQAVQGAGNVNVSFSLMGLGAPNTSNNLYAVSGLPAASVPGPNGSAGLMDGGMGADGLTHPIAVSSNGALFVQSLGLPLQPCNAVRTTNCQHF